MCTVAMLASVRFMFGAQKFVSHTTRDADAHAKVCRVCVCGQIYARLLVRIWRTFGAQNERSTFTAVMM